MSAFLKVVIRNTGIHLLTDCEPAFPNVLRKALVPLWVFRHTLNNPGLTASIFKLLVLNAVKLVLTRNLHIVLGRIIMALRLSESRHIYLDLREFDWARTGNVLGVFPSCCTCQDGRDGLTSKWLWNRDSNLTYVVTHAFFMHLWGTEYSDSTIACPRRICLKSSAR